MVGVKQLRHVSTRAAGGSASRRLGSSGEQRNGRCGAQCCSPLLPAASAALLVAFPLPLRPLQRAALQRATPAALLPAAPRSAARYVSTTAAGAAGCSPQPALLAALQLAAPRETGPCVLRRGTAPAALPM